MYSQHPQLAKEFEAATPPGAKLPQRVSKKKTMASSYLRKKGAK